MNTLCAWPIRTVLFRAICAYCGKTECFYTDCDFHLAVLACDDPEHRRLAERDAKSWLHKNGLVRHKDYTQEPLFKETELLTMDVHVPRSSGKIDTEGWKIQTPSYVDYAFIRLGGDEKKWHIPVIKEDLLKKCISIQDLKLSLPEDKHVLLDAFEAKLMQGFYLAESLAYDEAKKLQEEYDNPTASSSKPMPEELFQPIFHPVYGPGRQFVPPRQEPVQEQGDPAQGHQAQGDQA
jgi:hypothetical protein